MNEGIAPEKRDAELDRRRQRGGRIAGMKIQIAKILSRSLINDAKENSERNVEDQPAADKGGGTESGTRILRVIHGRDARATSPHYPTTRGHPHLLPLDLDRIICSLLGSSDALSGGFWPTFSFGQKWVILEG